MHGGGAVVRRKKATSITSLFPIAERSRENLLLALSKSIICINILFRERERERETEMGMMNGLCVREKRCEALKQDRD